MFSIFVTNIFGYIVCSCIVEFQLDVHYLHHHAAINSSIDLNPSPQLEVSAAIGSKDIAIGGEVGFDTSSSSFTKYNAGISFNKQDFSAAVLLYATVLLKSTIHILNLSVPFVLFYKNITWY